MSQTDTNLDNTDLDRSLIVAIVTAAGSGIAISANDITLPSPFSGGITANNTTNNITGVSIVRINTSTLTGTGTLNFTVGSSELTWIAPGDSSLEEMISETPEGFSINVAMGVHMSDFASGRFSVTGSSLEKRRTKRQHLTLSIHIQMLLLYVCRK